MSIRPIELQLSIPKTFDASKEQQNFLKKNDIEAQQNAISGNVESKKKLNSVSDTEKSEKKGLKNDSEGKKDGENNNSKKESKEKSNKDEQILDFIPGKLDIKI